MDKLERGDVVVHVYKLNEDRTRLNGTLAIVERFVPNGAVSCFPENPDGVEVQKILPAAEPTTGWDGIWTVAAWEKVGHIDGY